MIACQAAVSSPAMQAVGAASTRPRSRGLAVSQSLNRGQRGAVSLVNKPTVARTAHRSALAVQCGIAAQEPAKSSARGPPREIIRVALPSKGRMAEDTLELLNACQMSVKKINPRQYAARMAQIPEVEVWFQRASDCVRKLKHGDVDLIIAGYDMIAEYGDKDENIVIIHDKLDFGQCYLALGIPMGGDFAKVNSLEELKAMPCWTKETPLRVVTGYTNIAKRWFEEQGFEHVELSTADGALEASPAMGLSDIILDLVSTGTTLRENNLKMIEGGRITDSEGVLVANREALLNRPGLLDVVKEMLERLEAHLTAKDQYEVTANMKGMNAHEVAAALKEADLFGLDGPTISQVFTHKMVESGASFDSYDGEKMFAVDLVMPKKQLYDSVKSLRKIGGSGVLVKPLTYIFDEEPARWSKLLEELGIEE